VLKGACAGRHEGLRTRAVWFVNDPEVLPRFPLLAPTRDSFESGASAVARVLDRGCLAEV